MHPFMREVWRQARYAHGPCGGRGSAVDEARFAMDDHDVDFGGGTFGVRRPLRFLAHKLDLDDGQVAELAAVLSELKTERAQAAVDHRRSTAAFADALAGPSFDAGRVGAIADERVHTAGRLRDAVVKALGRIHGMLRDDQRNKLAYLIRTGALLI